MPDTDKAWLTLTHARVTAREVHRLVDCFGDVDAVAAANRTALERTGLAPDKARAITDPDVASLEAAADWLGDPHHELVALGDDRYPSLLLDIPGPPIALFVNGNAGRLQLRTLAIVGSRNPTAGGLYNAGEFAKHLAGTGFAIVSGLAQGIDTAAHRGALDAGGETIAVLGHGIDRVYPASNRDLAHEIAANGALVSEFPFGTQPHRSHFPQRNRIISGISLGTLVVEAARRSGSLITARMAGEQGREVFALPGSIHNPLARGCHQLIRQGAKLVETAEDIVSELAALTGHLQSKVQAAGAEQADDELQDAAEDIGRWMGHDPVSVDELIERSGLTIEQVSSMLLMLELKGRVERLAGGRYALLS